MVTDADTGLRLDAFLARELGLGPRPAKRLISGGFVQVAGKTRLPSCKLVSGSLVTLTENSPASSFPPDLAGAICLVHATADYASFFKPAGLHSACVTGSAAPSLEGFLRQSWDRIRKTAGTLLPETSPTLLNRLDRETSGLVTAALTRDAASRFRAWEADGLVRKDYLAIVRGQLTAPLRLRGRLDTDKRKKTRVYAENTPDETRHTLVAPLQADNCRNPFDFPVTPVTARIYRASRHQIRAHLADAGFPLLGDTLYGVTPEVFPLHLHHVRLAMPAFDAAIPPSWQSFPTICDRKILLLLPSP